MNKLDKLIAEINKDYNRPVVGFANEMGIDVERVSSGSIYLDWALGGGFPFGRVVEIFGPFSSGKTLIATKTIAEAQKLGFPTIFIDAENAFEPIFAQKNGVDLTKLVYFKCSLGEKLFDFIRGVMDSSPKGVIVVDSVASIVPEYEEENQMMKQTMGISARLMSKGIRIINGLNADKDWLIIFINQIREKIGIVYGNPETTPGGRALGFYSSIRLQVRAGEKYEFEKERIGHEIKARVEKSKVGIPLRDCALKFLYASGIDKIDETLSLALRLKILGQGGAWYTFGEERFQGRVAIEEKMKTEPAFMKKIEDEIKSKI